MEIDRKTNLILKHGDVYGSDPNYKNMVDNTVFLSEEDKQNSILHLEYVFGTEMVREAERQAHGS